MKVKYGIPQEDGRGLPLGGFSQMGSFPRFSTLFLVGQRTKFVYLFWGDIQINFLCAFPKSDHWGYKKFSLWHLFLSCHRILVSWGPAQKMGK